MAKQCIMAGTLNGGGYEKMLEQDRRVYSAEGASPTVRTKTGGNKETVIMEDIESGYEMYNGRKTLRGGGMSECLNKAKEFIRPTERRPRYIQCRTK